MSASDFKLVRPIAITDAILTSSSVPEATVAAYAGGTTYAIGNIIGVTTGQTQLVYQSLQNANTGHTPASSPTWWKYIGTVYAAYAGGTPYAIGDIVSSISTNVHLLYESLVASNTGNALTDTTKWLALGATNRWAMYDKAVNSQTTAPDTIVETITPGVIINTVTLLNVDAATVTISQSVSGYSKTKTLTSHNVNNWYDWYYEAPIRAGDVAFDDIPPYSTGVLTITIDNTGDTAACGCLFIGKSRVLGTTLDDASGGIISFSGTATDTFGNTTLVKRTNAKRLNVQVMIPLGFESEVHRLLSLYMDVELVVIASTDYGMAILYCYLGQWDVPISSNRKPASIELRGLI